MTVSVIIPVLNDAGPLHQLLTDLRADASLELVVVDGGSDDASPAVARTMADAVHVSPRGRAPQLRTGVAQTTGDWLWFLHADTRVDPAVLETLAPALSEPCWGWFEVRLDDAAWPFRVIETAMNLRARVSRIATGDQGIFVHRRLLEAVGGVPRQALMEDVELCKRLRRLAPPRRLGRDAPLVTSSRRWRHHGIATTVALMWWLRLRYFLNADPDALERRYYPRD